MDTATLMKRVTLRALRIRILISLDRGYPARLDDVSICALESEPPGLLVMRRELHYLAEKGLIAIDHAGKDSLHAAITAKGRDLIMGEFGELGIEPADSYGYTGV